MRVYTAHVKHDRAPILRREGWSWGAFILGPFWLVAQRAWVPAFLEFAALAFLLVEIQLHFWPAACAGLALLNGLLGLDLVRVSLARRGYRLAHVVVAPNADAALIRLLTAQPDLADFTQ